MAKGCDKLLDFLLSEIALRGIQGMHDSLRVLSLPVFVYHLLFGRITTIPIYLLNFVC